jgi:carbon storage regulator CsrA
MHNKKESMMLILTRKIGETLMVGDNVTVKVLSVKGNQIRLGVEAPRNISVHREEVYERIQAGETMPRNGGGSQNKATT